MTIQEKLSTLRSSMEQTKIDVYMIPSADYHQSEYVGDYFKVREFITGFTGSAGTCVITKDKAGLWTDGRYFIQAEKELAGSGIDLYKMGQPGVPTIDEFLLNELPYEGILGFDGRVISATEGKHYKDKFVKKKIKIEDRYDLTMPLWTDRPPMAEYPVFLLDEKYSGESTASKLLRVRKEMDKLGAMVHLLTSLDDIAWLLNIRGRDVSHTPVILCYAVISSDTVHLFINENKLSAEVKETLSKDHIILHDYEDVYSFIEDLNEGNDVLLDPNTTNYALYNCIPNHCPKIERTNPTLLFKAIKNKTEMENIRIAHIKDAVAHTKFMHWVKTTYDKETLTELTASDKLEEFRAEQENFLWPSFEPISAYGAHAAMCHYSSSPETDVELKPGTLYLTDTGGNYMEGSTDITRTVALGEISDELKTDFTNVLRGNLALSRTKFLYGSTGYTLDIIARQFLWNEYKDYNHGTGHGVGYLLSIHEPGPRIAWRNSGESPCILEEGMQVTNEPGIYVEDSHGIRLENELFVRKDTNNGFGQFMCFEVLTYVPFDLDAIDAALLSAEEKAQLNAYHKKVYDIVSPHLNDKERDWLKIYTREI